MANSIPAGPLPVQLQDTLADATATAKEQLQAAAQLQLDRLNELLSSGWHAQVAQVFEERLSDLGARMDAWYRAELEAESARVRSKSLREVSEKLNQAVRRLRNFENEAQWSQALVESTEGLCQRAALFGVNQQKLELKAARNLAPAALDPVPLVSAAAFASAVETKDTVVALRTPSELSEPISKLVGEAPDGRFSLFPIGTRDRVAAILYADSESGRVDSSALELLATVSGAVLDGLAPGGKRTPSGLHNIFGVEPAPKPATTWSELGKAEQELHLRAQRFARVRAAEMRLYQAQAVKDGRVKRDLYGELQNEIDAGRETFRREYMSPTESMVDYFHLELLRTLANDDADLLGSGYPGPLA